MKIKLADYCIRCGLCEDLYPDLFKRNYDKHCMDVLYEDIPDELKIRAKKAAEDCAVAAIKLELTEGEKIPMEKVPVPEGSESKSYYKYYVEPEINPVDASWKKIIAQSKGELGEGLSIHNRNELLNVELAPAKFGYYPLEEGGLLVAGNVPMPDVTAEMQYWWMAWHPLDPLRYAIWDQEDHFNVSINDFGRARALDSSVPMSEKTWGAVHAVLESTGGAPDEIIMNFCNPADVGYDAEKLNSEGCEFIICANASMGDMKIPVFMTEVLSKVDGVMTMQARFWVGYQVINGEGKYLLPPDIAVPEIVAKGLLEHNVKEFTHLNKILPDVFAEERDNW